MLGAGDLIFHPSHGFGTISGIRGAIRSTQS